MSTYKNLTTVCAAVVLAFGLAACGGGDDDTAMDDPVTTEPVEPPGPTQEELDAEKARADAAEQALKDKEAADAAAAAARAGRGLHAVMGTAPLTNLSADATDTPATPRVTLTTSGLAVGISDRDTAGAVTGSSPSPVMKATGDAGSLNGWEGTMYGHKAGLWTNDALVYTYKKGPPGKAAAEAFGADTFAARTEITSYSAADRLVTIATDGTSRNFKSDSFPTAGNTAYDPDDNDAIAFMGTLDGVPGTYRCDPGADSCSATMTANGIELTDGTWTFVHDAGGTTALPDTNYQYFGWWIRKFAGSPRSASAFFGVVGTGNTAVDVGAETYRGTATYSGSAAGKFAIDEPLTGTGDAGHFTADVSLSAKFGNVTTLGDESGISGTLSNFMANDEAVDWTVTLRRAAWGATGADTQGTFSRSSAGTVWSIGGNATDPSGSWSGRVYDDAAGDNSDVPTVAVGVFHSEAGSTHRMVGGFGATKD